MKQKATDVSELIGLATQILNLEARELLRAAKRIDTDIVKAAEIILNHSGKVVICGLGKSGLIGQKIVGTLCSTGTPAVFLHAAEALHGDLGIYHPGDPTILISKSGSTEEVLRVIPILREFRSPLIGIVGNPRSPMAQKVDVVLDASVSKEADPLGLVPTSSTTLTMAIGDALSGVLMAARGFKYEDFARFHPGGVLGKRLRLTVKDIMQPLHRVAQVKRSLRLMEAVVLMTEKPQGAALVLTDSNILEGIITEGDLRRCLLSNQDFNQLKVEQAMNPNPVSVSAHALLHDAVTLMEDRGSQISVLPVVEDDGKTCIGLLRLHDLYQTKLM
jgi:arabinose-5-phosphate isomerase